MGGKGDDAARYNNAAKYAPEGVQFVVDVFDAVGGSTPISASDIRNRLDNITREDLIPFIPDRLINNDAVIDKVYAYLANLPSVN